MSVNTSDSTSASSMRRVVRVAYCGSSTGRATPASSAVRQRLQQTPAGLGEEGEQAERSRIARASQRPCRRGRISRRRLGCCRACPSQSGLVVNSEPSRGCERAWLTVNEPVARSCASYQHLK